MGFLNALKIQHKLALLCSTFLLPIGFLTYLFIAQTEGDVSFAAKEHAGCAYFAALLRELQTLVALSLGEATAEDVAKAQEEVHRFDATRAAAMNAADAAAKATAAVRDAEQRPPGTPIAFYDEAIDAVIAHIGRVEDGSNLTLDPVLDSYYVQELVLEKIPQVMVAASRGLGAALASLAVEHPTPEMTVRLLGRKEELETAAEGIASALVNGGRGNADGSIKALDAPSAALAQRVAAYNQQLDEVAAPGTANPSASDLRTAQAAVQEAAQQLSAVGLAELDHLLQRRIDHLGNRMALSLGLTLAVFLAAVGLAAGIALSISRPLHRLHQIMHALALGDTAVAGSHIDRGDEIGVMARDVEVFRHHAIELSRLVEQVSDGAQAQLAALRLVAAAIGQSTEAITEVSRSTQAAHELSANISGQVGEGRERMRVMAQVVEGTAKQARRVDTMAESISRIAEQTHMLALNAAIEAARVGEHSKGFAVVAEEVRKLAEQSGALAQGIGEVVRSATAEAQRAVSMVDHVTEQMEAISQNVQRNDTLTAAVATSMEEQQATVMQINQNVDGLTRIAQSNADAASGLSVAPLTMSHNNGQIAT